jgi:ABC-type sugar transport system substrate-binding protein
MPATLPTAGRYPAFLPLLAAVLLAGCSGERKPAAPAAGASAERPAGTAAAKPRRFIFITNGDDPFWDALLSGLKEGEQQFGCAAAGITVAERAIHAPSRGIAAALPGSGGR